jgi:hypothetical protein
MMPQPVVFEIIIGTSMSSPARAVTFPILMVMQSSSCPPPSAAYRGAANARRATATTRADLHFIVSNLLSVGTYYTVCTPQGKIDE